MQFKPHPYQQHAIEHILTHPAAGLFMEMGTGKTVSTLTAIDQLIYDRFEINKVLVIAPKFVSLNVWPQEIQKWDHLKHLTISVVTGDPARRSAALKAKADIHIINRENVAWLVRHYQSKWPFDMVVIDELSSFKDNQSQRFSALRIVRPMIKRIVGLTGTPAPNGIPDLWSQLYLLDQGQRLGKTLTAFRESFLVKKENGFGYRVRKGSEKEVYDRISDICISMKSEDYLQLPGRIEHEIVINFDIETQKKYDQFEKDSILAMADETEISALSAGVLVNKLLQFSNGALYDSDKNVHEVHDMKLDALEEIVEQAGGQQVLIFYNYIHDRERILSRFKTARQLKGTKDIEEWDNGKVGLLIAHPASAGHGLNLQAGGNIIVWFGPTWSLELYQQANARLDRQGQTKPVMIYKLICAKTMDQQVAEVISKKADGQEALMQAVKAKIDYYRKKAVI